MDLEDNQQKRPNNTENETNGNTKTQAESFLSLNYMQKFFDVNQYDIKDRLMVITNPNKLIIADALVEKPDLYGPFWIATSLIFCLFAFGNLSGIFSVGIYSYDLIGSAASCIYG